MLGNDSEIFCVHYMADMALRDDLDHVPFYNDLCVCLLSVWFPQEHMCHESKHVIDFVQHRCFNKCYWFYSYWFQGPSCPSEET